MIELSTKTGSSWAESIIGGGSKFSSKTKTACDLEQHWHPCGLNFLAGLLERGIPALSCLLYIYILVRASPDNRPRKRGARHYGHSIQKGEFFEGKEAVADFFGKQNISARAKRNWFKRTVKPLIDAKLLVQIKRGRGAMNATYVVTDVREQIETRENGTRRIMPIGA